MYKVSLHAVSKSFGKSVILKNINLTIEPGEFFFLLGPSGCGKTTLLRIITGFEQPDGGEVLFDNAVVTRSAPQNRNTSMVFQNYALWPHLTVWQNVAFGLQGRGADRANTGERIGKILRLVQMEDYAHRSPNQLSGGQQQRIALARALVVNPQLILLDEPLSNLDARLRAEMRFELLRLHKETGITTIYVTHDQEEALSMADRIAFMDNGELIQVGTPRELYKYPVNARAGSFLGNANCIQGTIKSISRDRVEIESPLGLIVSSHGAAAHSPGSSVECFFRPESLQPCSETGNGIHGTVVSALYNGNREHLYCSADRGQFQALIPAPEQPTKAGTVFHFTIDPSDVLVFGA